MEKHQPRTLQLAKISIKNKSKIQKPQVQQVWQQLAVPEERGCLVTATRALMAGTTAGPVNREAKQRQKYWGSRRTTLQHPTWESHTVPA